MPSTFNCMAQSQQPPIGKVVVGKKPEPEPGKVGVKVKAAIFFDGTGNNQRNITRRTDDSTYGVHRFNHADWESYEQYYSNVAILYFMHQKKVPGEHIVSVYMEGIGTSDYGPDDTSGGGFGAGPTGVVGKVNKGINDLAKGVKDEVRSVDRDAFLEELTVCAFGFSRGAAAARHFCARRTDSRGRLNNLCQALGVKPEVVKIKFVGLFDSVSSFDETGEVNPAAPTDETYKVKAIHHYQQDDKEFRNDVAELHLTLDDPTLGKVVHLVADDEYRVNFSATTIASAIRRNTGFELRLPGAHSDIGGGYADQLLEKREYGRDLPQKVFQFFRERGWYRPEHLTTCYEPQGEDLPPRPYVVARRTLRNRYQYVALSIMLQLATKARSGMRFVSPNKDGEGKQRGIPYAILAGDPLLAVKNLLEADALARFGAAPVETPPGAGPLLPLTALPPSLHQQLRGAYLHLSWSDRLGFEFRKDPNGLPTRLIIAG